MSSCRHGEGAEKRTEAPFEEQSVDWRCDSDLLDIPGLESKPGGSQLGEKDRAAFELSAFNLFPEDETSESEGWECFKSLYPEMVRGERR